MKIRNSVVALLLTLSVFSCQVSDFEEAYPDPSKISETSVEKQFSGFLQTNREYVLPSYWNYFVVLRITLNRYNQSVGWVNGENQYVPGSAAISDRWGNYYSFLAQYRELEKVYNALPAEDKTDKRIYMIAANTYLYDHTQKVVDLHGDIPWSEAGMLSTNGGDYSKSYAKYDAAEDIYKKMLDDLKTYADEMSTLTVRPAILVGFRTQDFLNKGDLMKWRKYINSLRIRMLTRVSGHPSFASRYKAEMAEILGNQGKYPIVTANEDNVQINVFNLGTPLNSTGFRTGLEDWNGNVAGKAMIDHMKANQDPRLRVLFEPGEQAGGQYTGLDPMLNPSTQNDLVGGGTLAIYNRSTLSRNQYFPGMLITASEIHLLVAEYYLNEGNDASAKTHYETAIRQSVQFYYQVRGLSNDNTVPAPAPATPAEINAYLGSAAVDWTKATNPAAKLKLISSQKWLHFNVVQPIQNWAEQRRNDALNLSFWVDQSNNQSQPPLRWIYPGSEQTYNLGNYQAVQPKDNLNTRLFWDVK